MPSKLNIILSILIIAVIGAMAFFGFRAWRGGVAPQGTHSGKKAVERFEPKPVINRGKASQERDAVLEGDVRNISDAVVSYANDHKGVYPKSDFKNPCSIVRMCLKGVDINTKQKIYLDPVPQFGDQHADYYYSADNQKKDYCVKTPNILETENTKLFQCTKGGCGRVALDQACR